MKNILRSVLLITLFISTKAFAQSYEVPKDYHFTKPEDYTKYEADVVKTADWLMHTHWGTEPVKSEAATQFILKWTEGTPDVVIELKQAIMDLSDTNPQLGFIYMSQFSKYAIQHKQDFNKTQANLAALKAVIAKYTAEPTHKHDNDVEQLIKLDKENKLEAWLANEFSFQ
ncbi:hypothetical protein NAF17_01625 [Mucilaginibacter sp. RB4R14]|uniref:hypothetical protein n=1 Tax=Mucilaginibacter aurantiaciroseus TaxID=2949308 RepID=UPI002091BA83|nr:hypothetical protein [Mucilaginibacter aurantiaciroseus]MCO5934224.1 hypothetical protein [Mucilaginibacter aurantiaciroseus]